MHYPNAHLKPRECGKQGELRNSQRLERMETLPERENPSKLVFFGKPGFLIAGLYIHCDEQTTCQGSKCCLPRERRTEIHELKRITNCRFPVVVMDSDFSPPFLFC